MDDDDDVDVVDDDDMVAWSDDWEGDGLRCEIVFMASLELELELEL